MGELSNCSRNIPNVSWWSLVITRGLFCRFNNLPTINAPLRPLSSTYTHTP